ncbi:MAG TPA: amidohydrolase family protein [Thermoanaerobaculia bacterium]|nr:amidohydrolase family protein [Thermoanaerobaculia bacterium]
MTPTRILLASFLVLTNVTLIDPGRDVHRPGMTVVVEGERIAAVFPAGERALPEGATIHDLGGRFLLPGLIDSHTHLTPLFAKSAEALNRDLQRMLDGGIVAARDMAGNPEAVAAARTAERAPDIVHAGVVGGPHFIATGVRVARAGTGAQTVTAGSDVRAIVAHAKERQAAALKLYTEIDGTMIRALTSEAHRQGLQVWAHATVYPVRPIDVVRSGVDAISHLCGLAWQDADLDPTTHTRINEQTRPRFEPRLVDAESPEMQALFEEMVRRGTILDATLSNHLRPGDDAYGCTSQLMVALAKAAHRAGVFISTGTDYRSPDDDPYPSLHREIESLVDEGVLTAGEALTAATLHGARALGREHDYGTIEPGKLASFVILANDPREDIRALRSIVSVVKRGKLYPSAAEKASIEQLIRDALIAEQKAFESGGCAEALVFFADREPLFVGDGRTFASRTALRSRCGQIPQRKPGLPRRLQQHAVHVLSPLSGYSVTHYRFDGNDATEVVTKIWEKSGSDWRIVHLHQSSSP